MTEKETNMLHIPIDADKPLNGRHICVSFRVTKSGIAASNAIAAVVGNGV